MSGAYCTLHQLISLRIQARKLPLLRHGSISRNMSGNIRTSFKGRGIDFEEVRAYQFGDDIRSIDWRVTARRMKPHTKVFQEERERPVFILLDQSHSMFFGSQLNFKSVTAAELSSLIAWAAFSYGDRIGGIIFNEYELYETKPKRSRKAVMHWLHNVELMNHKLKLAPISNIDAKSGLTNTLKHTRRLAKTGTHIFIISDFKQIDAASEQHIAKLAQHNELMAIKVNDPLEQELPDPDQYMITDGMHTLSVNTGIPKLRQQFRQQYQLHNDQLRKMLSKYRIPLLQINSTKPSAQQLLALYGVNSTSMTHDDTTSVTTGG